MVLAIQLQWDETFLKKYIFLCNFNHDFVQTARFSYRHNATETCHPSRLSMATLHTCSSLRIRWFFQGYDFNIVVEQTDNPVNSIFQ
jgi:hypothetical protein